MIIGSADIARLIPHSGAMCLLERVLDWDDASIRCLSTRHRAEDNPLRSRGRLAAVCGVEFAAQAMAVHGALAAGAGPRPMAGYLASLRELTCRCERLDGLAGDLVIAAERVMGDARQAVYRFALHCDRSEILAGRATVVLAVGPE